MMLFIRFQNVVNERRERGAAMAEYGLLLALVALAAIVVLSIFGDTISDVFSAANDDLKEGLAKAEAEGGTTEGEGA